MFEKFELKESLELPDNTVCYVDDISSGILGLINKPSVKSIPYNCFNIGSSKPANLKRFLSIIEKNLGKKAKINNLPIQNGDVKKTHAGINLLSKYSSYKPKIGIDKGIKEFVNWYKNYYKKK